MIQDIRCFTLEELEKNFKLLGVESYRAKQVFDWVYKKDAIDFVSMKNLSGEARDKIAQYYKISPLLTERIEVSADRVEKFLFKLEDGAFIESVLIPSSDRLSVCLSTQVGCRFACAFCASGSKGFKRNLDTSEILGQFLAIKKKVAPERISNVIFMGIGEPLDNYDNLLKAIRILNHEKGINLGIRKMTISSVGLAPAIERLSKEGMQIELSISLHAAQDAKRKEILPVNKSYPLKVLMPAIEKYANATKRKITFEYVLLSGFNTSLEDAQALVKLLRGLICRVNLIPYNETNARGMYKPPTKMELLFFKDYLLKNGIDVTLRITRGRDIMAACGQLKAERS
ncbi:MAG: 23S rRNA (adenine(2503)-C(2))-methyltransferase RlmN [Candidatus Omnitrophota bacterium]